MSYQQFVTYPQSQSNAQLNVSKFTTNPVMSFVQSGNGLFLRSLDANITNSNQTSNQSSNALMPQQNEQSDVNNVNNLSLAFTQNNITANIMPQCQLLTLPVQIAGAKPGDPPQTIQIQVLTGHPSYELSQLPIQFAQNDGGGGNGMLAIAANNGGLMLQNNGQMVQDGVAVVAMQPHEIQMLQGMQMQQTQSSQESNVINVNTNSIESETRNGTTSDNSEMFNLANIKMENQNGDYASNDNEMDDSPDNNDTPNQFMAEYIKQQQRTVPNSSLTGGLNQFLRFNNNSDIKREQDFNEDMMIDGERAQNPMTINDIDKAKRRRKTIKKKALKEKKQKPGQIHIARALDGTTLFCCPECHMAYPEKESLEQHLVTHKIERRYICDTCGAGLKRKEHLERHKLGHSPERPFICTVCNKGFKRKEHLNLHAVIHSGEKKEICGECGKRFFRRDHLRKHARSHVMRRLKEELNSQGSNMFSATNLNIVGPTIATIPTTTATTTVSNPSNQNSENITPVDNTVQHVTIQVGSTSIPLQIQVPHSLQLQQITQALANASNTNNQNTNPNVMQDSNNTESNNNDFHIKTEPLSMLMSDESDDMTSLLFDNQYQINQNQDSLQSTGKSFNQTYQAHAQNGNTYQPQYQINTSMATIQSVQSVNGVNMPGLPVQTFNANDGGIRNNGNVKVKSVVNAPKKVKVERKFNAALIDETINRVIQESTAMMPT